MGCPVHFVTLERPTQRALRPIQVHRPQMRYGRIQHDRRRHFGNDQLVEEEVFVGRPPVAGHEKLQADGAVGVGLQRDLAARPIGIEGIIHVGAGEFRPVQAAVGGDVQPQPRIRIDLAAHPEGQLRIDRVAQYQRPGQFQHTDRVRSQSRRHAVPRRVVADVRLVRARGPAGRQPVIQA